MEVRDRSPLVHALQHPFVGMVCLSLLMFFAGLGQGDVRIDGAVYAWVSKWIVVGGDWLTLYVDRGQTPYFDKPPLQFWLMAISYKLFGISTWSAKLITPIFGLLCVMMTYALARFRYSPAVAATAGIVLALTYTFFRHAVGIQLDPGAAMFVLIALWCAMSIDRRRDGGLWVWALMGVAWGLGMMLKGPMVLVAAAITGIGYAWMGRRDLLLNWRWLAAAVVAIAIWGPWHLHQYLTHGSEFTRIYFGREMFGWTDASHRGSRSIGFYLATLVTDDWPWLPLSAAGLWLLAKKAWSQREVTVRFLVVWAVVWLVAVHLAVHFYDGQLLAWYPAAAIAAAYALSRTRVWVHWRRWVLPNVAVVSLVLLVIVEVLNVQLHLLDAPAVRSAAPAIRDQVALAVGNDGPAPQIYVLETMSPGSRCRLRFYTNAEVTARGGETFDWSTVPPGNFIALPTDSPLHGRLPRVLPIAEDARTTIYRVLDAADDRLIG